MRTEALDYDDFYTRSKTGFLNAIKDFKKNKPYADDRMAEYLAYMVALETGLRVSDLLELKYGDFSIDLNTQNHNCWEFTTYIKKTKQQHTGVISYNLGHTISDDYEPVPFQNRCKYIFWNYKTNKPYTRQWLHKRIKIISKNLGFENCGVHSIRKASAINVLNKTGSLSLAQYHLTHKRATTTDKYLGVTQASALEQLAKVF